MKYHKEQDKVFVKLEVGDKIHQSLEAVADELGIKAASVVGIGVFRDPELGLLNLQTKSYDCKVFEGDYEVTNLTGNLTEKEGKAFAHTHLTMVGKDYNAIGGHLVEATVSGAAEFVLHLAGDTIGRTYSDQLGIFLWDMPKG